MRKLSIQDEKKIVTIPITKGCVCEEALYVNTENKEYFGKKRTRIDNVRKLLAKSYFSMNEKATSAEPIVDL